jgi:surface antigen Omp85-like protein
VSSDNIQSAPNRRGLFHIRWSGRLPMPSKMLRSTVLVIAVCLSPGLSRSQVATPDKTPFGANVSAGQEKEPSGIRNGSVIVAPIPFSNPMIGAGLALGGGYLFKTGPDTKTSVLGIGAMQSDNGSNAAGVVANLAFDNNRWLFESFIGEAKVRYDLFTSLGTAPIRQDGVLGRFKLAYGVTPDLSFGGTLRYLNTSIAPDAGLGLPPALTPDLDMEIVTVGLIADWDKRDEPDYPTSGFRLSSEIARATVIGGTDRDYATANIKFDYYHTVTRTGILAARAVVCGVSSDTPFFDQCSIGATDNFRGFNSTQFLNLRSTSLQLEYRHRFSPRWGGVAFGGVGWTGPSLGQLSAGGTHSAIGLGVRYRVSKKFPVDFSVDASHANDGSNQLYIYVGQRF